MPRGFVQGGGGYGCNWCLHNSRGFDKSYPKKMYFLLNLGSGIKSYVRLCQVLAFYHDHSPKKLAALQYSCSAVGILMGKLIQF